MATVLIMYYKQISEGHDDKKRYAIMQKVGLSKDEIKQSIKSQVLIVFFLPLVAACIHIAFAFNVITHYPITGVVELNKCRVICNLYCRYDSRLCSFLRTHLCTDSKGIL